MTTRVVNFKLVNPGNNRPLANWTFTVQLNTPGFADGGASEIERSATLTTDADGLVSEAFVPNSEIQPSNSAYTARPVRGVIWTFVVEPGDTPVNLFDCLVVDPTNPNPIVAGADVDLSNVDPATGRAALGLGTAATHASTDFDAAGAAASAQTAAASDATSKVAAEATARAAAVTGAITTAATDATTKVAAEATRAEAAEALLIPLSQKGAASGVATLDSGGKLTAAQIPAISLNTIWPGITSQAAMLALAAEPGDIALRTDITTGGGQAGEFMLAALPASTLGNWVELNPVAGVSSVAGRTGAVTLSTSDVSGAATAASVAAEATRAEAAEALLAPLTSAALVTPTINGHAPVTADDGRLTGLFPNLLASGDTTGATDTAAMQALINAGKNVVLSPQGAYWISGAILKTGVHIYINSATVKLPNGSNGDVFVTDQFASLTGTSTDGGPSSFGVHGPGFIDGNRTHQSVGTTPPTTTAAAFNLSASFSLALTSTAGLPSSGQGTLRTQSGPASFSWSANNTGTNTLTCTTGSTGRVITGTPVYTDGYGIRIYGSNFDIDGQLNIHNCVVDGLWTEWAPTIAVGAGTPEMESRVSRIKCYENNRNGYSFMGPHDSMIDSCIFFRNGAPGLGIGLVTANSSIAYVSNCHTWGSPQQIGFEDHTASHFVNCYGEMTSASGSRAWVFYGSGVYTRACHALWAGSGGNVGVEIQNSLTGADIDMMFTGGFGNGALLITISGGGNRITGVANSLLANPIVSGTPDATDVIRISAGTDTSTASFSSGVYGSAAGTAVQGNDVRAVTNVTTTDPLVSSDSASGYGAGSRWINTTKNAMFTCLSAAVGAAVWQRQTVDVQTFTTSGTWTKPAWAQTVSVVALGGGGGGGAGARQASGSACSGGAGGAGGGTSLRALAASLCGSTEAVTVSSSGASGAAAQTTNSSAGAAGTAGSAVLFGNHVRAAGGAGGPGGALNAGNSGPSGGGGLSLGGAGAAGANGAVGANAATAPCPGGGAGGGISTTPTAFAGGNGAQSSAANYISGGSGGGAAGGTGGQNGISASANEPSAGSSGGGGGASTAGAGGAGGVAGSYGAGGGGGGSSLNGSASGAGGNGAPGIVVVITT